MGEVEVLESGFFSTIQDEGRLGFSKFGVPRSGAMDKTSFRLANALLGNQENDACIEWVFQAPVLKFSAPTSISITGAFTECFLNGVPVKMYSRIFVKKGDVFSSNFCKNKKYGYVGIRNGFLSDVRLGSRSFFKSITSSPILSKDDEMAYQKDEKSVMSFSSISDASYFDDHDKLMVYKGAEFDQLTSVQKEVLLNSEFTISDQANRMAIQLIEKLKNTLPSMLTSPVLPGTLQLTPSGKLIVLMRDCQTTGGYPRVLQLSNKAIDIIAQKRRGEKCKFQLVEE
ncbi:hypothetical protein AWE51_20025 [Aquimarina aggregata]|uniref:Carboxyltransferase domain-containing protein n=1 Tax=Aquimarina aggregata TaxID=1642818 RepID=A0A162DK89_9FLAO|nr:biotin-dependent carboxyltransferase family protein [Aquimarina aggregata]KZS41688.1 hypothetical protein AWE51_20025 [Aquimarina aggregata]